MKKKNGNINGVGSLRGGDYKSINVNGMGKLKDDALAEAVQINGMFKSVGMLKTDSVEVNGFARIFQPIQARRINISGLLKVRRAGLSADEITCSGVLICNREVNGDFIRIDGFCSVAHLCGTTIHILASNATIFSKKSKLLLSFLGTYLGRKVNEGNSLVDLLECETLIAEGLQVKEVHAQKAVFKNGCHVGSLTCEEYEADESCIIEKVVTGVTVGKKIPKPPKIDSPQGEAIEALFQQRVITRTEADFMLTSLVEPADTTLPASEEMTKIEN